MEFILDRIDDYGVTQAMRSSLKRDERHARWLMNFMSKGYPDWHLRETGRAAKVWKNNQWEYAILGGTELHGGEIRTPKAKTNVSLSLKKERHESFLHENLARKSSSKFINMESRDLFFLFIDIEEIMKLCHRCIHRLSAQNRSRSIWVRKTRQQHNQQNLFFSRNHTQRKRSESSLMVKIFIFNFYHFVTAPFFVRRGATSSSMASTRNRKF